MKIALIFCFLLFTGCSFHWKGKQGDIQHRGLVYYKNIHTDRAQTFEMYTFGFQLRFLPKDSGLSLGYRKFISVKQALKDQNDEKSVSSGVFLCSESVSTNAVMFFRKQFGLELGVGLLINGITLGYDKAFIVEAPQLDVSVIRKIDFYEEQPFLTYVYQSIGD